MYIHFLLSFYTIFYCRIINQGPTIENKKEDTKKTPTLNYINTKTDWRKDWPRKAYIGSAGIKINIDRPKEERYEWIIEMRDI